MTSDPRNLPENREIIAALDGARQERDAANAVSAARPFPRITDTLEGFSIEVEPPSPGGRRFVEVVLSAYEPLSAATYDTEISGKSAMDRAIVRRETLRDFEELASYLAEEGMSLQATVDGRPGAFAFTTSTFTRRPALGVYEVDAEGRPDRERLCAEIEFGFGEVSAYLPDMAVCRGTDWHELDDDLREHSVVISAALVEPAPSMTP